MLSAPHRSEDRQAPGAVFRQAGQGHVGDRLRTVREGGMINNMDAFADLVRVRRTPRRNPVVTIFWTGPSSRPPLTMIGKSPTWPRRRQRVHQHQHQWRNVKDYTNVKDIENMPGVTWEQLAALEPELTEL